MPATTDHAAFDAARIQAGAAVLIRFGGGPSLDDEARALVAAFETGPHLQRTLWRSPSAFAVTQAPAIGEAAAAERQPRSAGTRRALAFGDFFGGQGDDEAADRLLAWAAGDRDAWAAVNGAWVGVVWDEATREVLCLRDAPGIATIHAAPLAGGVLVGTDLRVFAARPELAAADAQALAEFLHYLYVPAPRTAFAGVHAVLPGHCWRLTAPDRQERIAPPRLRRRPGPAGADAVAGALPAFEEHLRRAVRDCLPPRGRIALALSGGKDSSAVAIALSQVCPERVLAFNVGSADKRHDEASDAALVCQTLGLAFTTYTPTDDDLAEGVRDFVAAQDQPIGDPAALPYYLAMRRLPDDCRVVVDGTGNDYYFGIPDAGKGAQRFDLRRRISRLVPAALWPAVPALMAAGPAWMGSLARYWRRPIEETFVAWEGWTASELADLAGTEVSFAGTELWRVMRAGAAADWLDLLTDVVCGVWEPHTAYRKAVFFANAAGRRVRFPFADDRLADFVNGLPDGVRFAGGRNKVLLRAYLARYLPDEILGKPKAPFVFDLDRVLRNPRYDWLADLERGDRLAVLPSWNRAAAGRAADGYRRSASTTASQQRIYALALLADVWTAASRRAAGPAAPGSAGRS
jgi:asparagine synthase (glutamine-hydrolysing)